MTTERLNEMLDARPFRPFALRLADGELVRVEHPEFVARSPGGRTVVVFSPDDHMKILDLFLVTSLETVPPGKNGRKRRR
ncbi:MAG TPA: hypothetical protein VFB66_26125 [Tepidisphaeraceae bacterium]|nr:hypothetical protein [Tepidisphaeraceae bacterium]